ncbi:diacylglycerol/lipid kinase family protein [Actinocorallia lasiicapitis]
MLIANSKATSTTQRARDLLVRAFAGDVEVELADTQHRRHAIELAERAAREGYDLVIALGGDGTVNEVVNGLMRHGEDALDRPALAVLPGGNANVFARALGLPNDPIRSLAAILGALRTRHFRTIGLGHVRTPAEERYFTFTAGIGLDAEVVHAVDLARRNEPGHKASNRLYVQSAVRQFFALTDRQQPALEVRDAEGRVARGLYLAFVSNTSPWTYLGPRAVYPSPRAGFSTGLDLFGIRSLNTFPTLSAILQMMIPATGGPRGRHVVELHDAPELTVTARRPIALQVDGDYLGERQRMVFRSVPKAVRVVI